MIGKRFDALRLEHDRNTGSSTDPADCASVRGLPCDCGADAHNAAVEALREEAVRLEREHASLHYALSRAAGDLGEIRSQTKEKWTQMYARAAEKVAKVALDCPGLLVEAVQRWFVAKDAVSKDLRGPQVPECVCGTAKARPCARHDRLEAELATSERALRDALGLEEA